MRGLPPFNAVLDDIKQIQDYRVAELMAAKVAACLGIFYERNGNTPKGDFLDEEENEDKGEFVQGLEPGMASIAPNGYSVKSLAPTHPNNGYGEFNKSILKQIASSLGVSYAKLLKDYEAVNYSSLREGTLDEAAFYAEMQSFLIENWKEIEFKLFLESYIVNCKTDLKASQVNDLLKYHIWISQKRAYFDKAKDIIAEKYAIELGLKSPIMLLEEEGVDPEEVLKSYALWKSLCDKYQLDFKAENKATLEPVETQSTEEIANKNRD